MFADQLSHLQAHLSLYHDCFLVESLHRYRRPSSFRPIHNRGFLVHIVSKIRDKSADLD